MAIYSYVLSESFPYGIKVECLHKEINDANFPQILNGVTTDIDNDNIKIEFDDNLSSSDEIILNDIISNHDPNYICLHPNPILPSFTIDIGKRNNNVSSSTWLDRGASNVLTGSWSGFSANNIAPIVIPYDCKLSQINVVLKGVNFNWRGTSGEVHFSLAFYKLAYNGTTEYNSFKFKLQGEYSGSSFDNENHVSIIDFFEMNYGENIFNRGDIFGVMFRVDTSGEGRINTLRRPNFIITFEEIVL